MFEVSMTWRLLSYRWSSIRIIKILLEWWHWSIVDWERPRTSPPCTGMRLKARENSSFLANEERGVPNTDHRFPRRIFFPTSEWERMKRRQSEYFTLEDFFFALTSQAHLLIVFTAADRRELETVSFLLLQTCRGKREDLLELWAARIQTLFFNLYLVIRYKHFEFSF